MGEVCHLGWAGVGVEEVEDVGVVGWEAVPEVNGFHGAEEGVGGVVVVEVARASCERSVKMRRGLGGKAAYIV